MNGIKVKIDDIVTGNTFEMTKFLVRIICVSKGLSLSDTEINALSHFVINGYSKVSREKLIETKLLKNKNSVANLVHAFRKYGIIVKNNMGEELFKDFRVPVNNLDGIKVEILIKK